MWIVLALLAFVLMGILWRRRIADWRERFIIAAVVWGAYAVGLTETLSAVNRLTPRGVAVGWALACVIVAAVTRWIRPSSPAPPVAAARLGGFEKWVLLPAIALLAIVLGLVAWHGPPNNADSMVYHLPRVFHWIQNRNVEFYPTSVGRQLEMAPGAEYLILQLQILSHDDRWADLVQWFAYVGCIIGVSLIARSLGGNVRAQVLAAVFMATLPMACLQAETTQNDLVSAFWLICFLIFLLRICREKRGGATWPMFALCGVSLGLGLLTKSTIYIFAAPFGIALAVITLWRMKGRGAGYLAVLGLIALALNGPSFVRNHRYSHAFLGNGGYGNSPSPYANVHLGPRATISNMLRNLALEFTAAPPGVRQQIETTVRAAHYRLGLDPDNPNTTFIGKFDLASVVWNSEDYAANPAWMILVIAALITLAICGWRRDFIAVLYAVGIVAGFILFCAYLRWQPWHNRLHLPLLAACSALVGVVIQRYWNRRFSLGVIALLPLLVIPWVLSSVNHPLYGSDSIFSAPREALYFSERPLFPQYTQIVDCAAKHHARQVAIYGDGDVWEYPLDRMLQQRVPGVRVVYYASPSLRNAAGLHTRNRGFDPKLRPYLVVDLAGFYTARIMDVVK